MTPVAVLVAFCAAMAAIAVGRLVVADAVDPVDVGSTVVVVGITVMAGLWAALEESLLAPPARLALAVLGVGTVCVGLVVMVRYWDEPSTTVAPDDRC